ncbi:Reverse transcriptase zinc-binding domain [Arabidopsis thaliana x Arabidopsis arenosa]|uniref:Reverse transcriptase zinc-binding domain n=1 Tax=Arabidopsis thaliana x Arabidopsis arenosa TaxID=1240361 RepID=A0A8T2E0E9_9BRAS|nr:Reverse transcriptase zinc-binding domain [Arabidopsis thaliana x Arabidopsis arenosa]
MGTGGNIWFWYDNWTPMGPLIRYLGDSGPSCLRILLSARVANAYNNVGWLLAPPRSDMALSLHIHLSTIPLPADSDGEDVFGWFVDGKLCGNFTASKTWEALRPRDTVKDWAPLIWFKGSTPRHAFNMWVSNLDRLPTLARLAAWGLQGSVLCGFCSASTETRDHIFLLCPFTKVIWSLICQRLGDKRAIFNMIITQLVFWSWNWKAPTNLAVLTENKEEMEQDPKFFRFRQALENKGFFVAVEHPETLINQETAVEEPPDDSPIPYYQYASDNTLKLAYWSKEDDEAFRSKHEEV